MAHKGLREFDGMETGGLALGQLGFTEVTGTGSAGTTGDTSGKDYFVGIKAVAAHASASSTSEIVFTAESLQGDDLSTTAMYPGDMIWGCFNYVNVGTNTSSYMKLLCYYGKKSS
tara:strand:- start:3879 stop:4223 length:345 start_codon:yes stop_codon:yes gene_type:complete